ncbi:11714_t:CDS:2 [Diversispora eburnea]|uniref:11714_t:CDS:1 n=1 Tax=Diversispora eburnea TaxID=1213867 RepID=A0A9N8V701_9GLOM|nr:11714_t:CDS:2 [Diversispora eburnea]
MFEKSESYFNLSQEEKLKYNMKDFKGYSSIYKEKLDTKKQYNGDFKDQELPQLFKDSIIILESFSKILQSFAIALKIPQNSGGKYWFENRHRYEAESGDTLRILHYPIIINNENDINKGKEEEEEIIRAGSHSDYGSLTILFQKDIGGLEILSNYNNSTPQWISAPVISNCLLINIADLLEFWSKGLFKSTIHRVVFRTNGISLDPIPSQIIDEFEEDIRIWNKIGEESYGKKTRTKMTAGDHLKYKLEVSYKNG